MSLPCGQLSLVADTSDGRRLAMPIPCRRWDCERCAPRMRKKLRRRLINGEPTALVTLTLRRPEPGGQTAAFHAASIAVHALVKRIRRAYPLPRFEYALIWERTKKGTPHAHLLIRGPYIPQRWLSRAWSELTGAQIVDIRRVQSRAQVANYVTKYLSKGPQAPPYCKRWRTTRLYSAAEPKVRLRDVLEFGTLYFSCASTESLVDAARLAGAEPQNLMGNVWLWPTAPPYLDYCPLVTRS